MPFWRARAQTSENRADDIAATVMVGAVPGLATRQSQTPVENAAYGSGLLGSRLVLGSDDRTKTSKPITIAALVLLSISTAAEGSMPGGASVTPSPSAPFQSTDNAGNSGPTAARADPAGTEDGLTVGSVERDPACCAPHPQEKAESTTQTANLVIDPWWVLWCCVFSLISVGPVTVSLLSIPPATGAAQGYEKVRVDPTETSCFRYGHLARVVLLSRLSGQAVHLWAVRPARLSWCWAPRARPRTARPGTPPGRTR